MTVESRRALGSRYELVDRLGAGAMGEVWRTWDRVDETWVAAKRLRSELTRDPQIVSRFVQERSILVGLDHPNVLRVRDLVVEGDDLAIVMDLVDGPDLGTHLRSQGTLTPRQAVTVTTAVLDALVAAHSQQCLHRDVKPDNVLLPDTDALDGALLSDFGIARLAQDSTVQATGLLGTPGYMPPELFTHGSFSAASDVYATGVLLYELLAGRTPFSGSGTAHTVGYRHVHSEPPPLAVAPPLWHLVSTMLAKDPARRLSAGATAAALRELPAAILDVPALPVQPAPETWSEAPETSVRGPAIRVQVQPADVDPGATNLHGGAVAEQTFAGTGQVEALVAAPAGLDDGETRLGLEPARHRAPRLEPAVRHEEPVRRRRWPWVVGVLALLAVTAGGLVLSGVLGGEEAATREGRASTGAAAAAAVEASGRTVDYASGLRTELSAVYDDAGRIDLQVELDAASTPLAGDLLLVLPDLDGTTAGCPEVTWASSAGEVVATGGVDLGLGIPCGYSLEPGTIDGPGVIEATVYADLDDVAEDARPEALQAWVDAIDQSTEKELDGLGRESDYAFPAQRVAGLEIRLNQVVRDAADKPIPYRVFPRFRDGDVGLSPLFVTPLAQQPTGALLALAGGSVDGVRVRTCDGARVDGLDLSIRYQTTDCFLEITAGELEGQVGFSIAATGS